MVDQVKLNDGDMICYLMKVSSWLRDTALFPVFIYPTKSVDPIMYLHIQLLVSPLLCIALEIHHDYHTVHYKILQHKHKHTL